MAKCEHCQQEMQANEITTCTYPFVRIGDVLFERNTTHFDYGERCHDCNIENKKGNVHHYGCDMEECPKCGEQMFCCDCDLQAVVKKV